MTSKPSVLFLGMRNDCRSQMAEAFLRHLAGDRFEAHSAGTHPTTEVHSLTIQVMEEIGLDISSHRPKNVATFAGRNDFWYLFILCDAAAKERTADIFPNVVHRLVWPFDDPASQPRTPEETLIEFRRLRYEIRERIRAWLATA